MFDTQIDKFLDYLDDGVTIKGEIHGWNGISADKGHRIDWILTNKNLNVMSSKCIFNGANKPFVSDHYGVEIQIDDINM